MKKDSYVITNRVPFEVGGDERIGGRTASRWILALVRAGCAPRDPDAAEQLLTRLEIAEQEQPGVGAEQMFDVIVQRLKRRKQK